MSCLFEFIFEVILEAFGEGFMYLMCLIIPKKSLSQKTYKTVKILVKIFAGILLLSMLLGFILMLSDDMLESKIGKYMFFIPLAISIFQIGLGIILKITAKTKK